MPLKINTTREYSFKHTVSEEEELNVTFKFPFAEEIDYAGLRNMLSSQSSVTNDEVLNEEEGFKVSDAIASRATLLHILRKSLTSCDCVDEEGNPIVIINPDKTVNEINQKAVFEVVKNIPELYEKVQTAYIGVKGKNSETGATQQ